MIKTGLWQNEVLEDVIHLFEKVDDTKALILIGSFANKDIQPDEWSDLDFVVVVDDGSIDRFISSLEWLSLFGDVFTVDRSSIGEGRVLRVCFEDFKRFDFLFIPVAYLRTPDSINFNPFLDGYKVIFSSIQDIDSIISQIPQSNKNEFQEYDLIDMIDKFWFKGMLAVYKVVRNDLLIAAHLTLDLVRACLVLKMKLRDQVKGNTFHRNGGGNKYIHDLSSENISFTPSGILNTIENSSIQFDTLGRKLDKGYKEKRHHLIEWINHARIFLGEK